MDDRSEQQRIVLRVRGHVQGVGYRINARRMAASLGINADPVNLPDGSVRVTAHGPRDAITAFRAWCAEGPADAVVESVEEEAR